MSKSETRTILSTVMLNGLAKKINAKAGSHVCSETLESVLENIGHLTGEITEFGESRMYLPLPIKEVILNLVFPNARTEVKLERWEEYTDETKTTKESFFCGEAYIYRDSEDTQYFASGRFAYTLSQYARDFHMEPTFAKASIGNWVRGLAKTRAIQSALPFLNLYCEEEILKNEAGIPETELPTPQPPATKGRKKKAEETPKPLAEANEPTEKEPVNNASTESAPEETESKAEENSGFFTIENEEIPFESAEAEQLSIDMLEQNMGMPYESQQQVDTVSANVSCETMSLEAAFDCIADCGTYQGNTLRDIYKTRPNNIVWLYNNSKTLKEAAKIIMENDEQMKGRL